MEKEGSHKKKTPTDERLARKKRAKKKRRQLPVTSAANHRRNSSRSTHSQNLVHVLLAHLHHRRFKEAAAVQSLLLRDFFRIPLVVYQAGFELLRHSPSHQEECIQYVRKMAVADFHHAPTMMADLMLHFMRHRRFQEAHDILNRFINAKPYNTALCLHVFHALITYQLLRCQLRQHTGEDLLEDSDRVYGHGATDTSAYTSASPSTGPLLWDLPVVSTGGLPPRCVALVKNATLLLHQALDKDPSHDGCLYCAAQLEVFQGEADKGMELLQTASQQQPDNVGVLWTLADFVQCHMPADQAQLTAAMRRLLECDPASDTGLELVLKLSKPTHTHRPPPVGRHEAIQRLASRVEVLPTEGRGWNLLGSLLAQEAAANGDQHGSACTGMAAFWAERTDWWLQCFLRPDALCLPKDLSAEAWQMLLYRGVCAGFLFGDTSPFVKQLLKVVNGCEGHTHAQAVQILQKFDKQLPMFSSLMLQ